MSQKGGKAEVMLHIGAGQSNNYQVILQMSKLIMAFGGGGGGYFV